MNLNDVLYSRKSIRSYTGEAITDEQLAEILKAAYASPVGRGNYDNVQITVITNPELLAKIDACIDNPDMHPLYGAPMLILISGPLGGTPADNISYSNAAIINHNMSLKAVELGIGHCDIWGVIMAMNAKHPEVVAELGLPEGFKPLSSLILGVTADSYTEREIPERMKTAYIK